MLRADADTISLQWERKSYIMQYVSTRGKSERTTAAGAMKQGLAGDGGLFVPEEIPLLHEDTLTALCGMTYPQRAAKILYMYLSDEYTEEELLSDCEDAYSRKRFQGGPAPVVALGEKLRVLELWHGPTAAFKDMALQIMPKLLSRALVKTGETRTAYILVATSGDTGKAAMEGYRDVDGVRITVFYPVDGVSRVQKLQMATQEGKNVSVHSVVGNFDDAQNGVKAIFSDPEAADTVGKNGYFFSSANSINWGRLVPQIVYYISAYCDLVNDGSIKMGDEINVCVPTGNFGNILAAYFAKKMGLPIHHLVCASNQNNVLTDFFATGEYNRVRPFYTTTSPSMDILISSNLERLLYMAAGAEETVSLMRSLKEDGSYRIDEKLRVKLNHQFTGMYCDEGMTAETIRNTYEKYRYLCDTHTAVGLHCANRYMEDFDKNRMMLSVSTASPYKFAPAVYRDLTGKSFDNELDAMQALEELTCVPVPAPLSGIEERAVRFDPEASIAREDMLKTVLAEM